MAALTVIFVCADHQITDSTGTEVDSSICSVWAVVSKRLTLYNAFVYIRGWYHVYALDS